MSKFSNNKNREYDLEERTAKFSGGANYCEANASSSKRDFRNKIFICKKEANETKYWLRMLAKHHAELKEKIRLLWQEAHEFHLIFQKITSTLDKKV